MVLIFLLTLGWLFLIMSWIRGTQRPYDKKAEAFECGFTPQDSITKPFSIRFAVVALLFLLFDVEIALLLPWTVCWPQLPFEAWARVMVFLAILAAGLVYEWKKEALE